MGNCLLPSSSMALCEEELYNALQYSGLMNEDMSFEEMCGVLRETYPAVYNVLLDLISHGIGQTNNQAKFNVRGYESDGKYVINGDSSTDSGYDTVYVYVNSKAYDFGRYSKIRVKLSSKNTPNNITFGYSSINTGSITTLGAITGTAEYEFDISNVTGNKWLKFSCWMGKPYNYAIEMLELIV